MIRTSETAMYIRKLIDGFIFITIIIVLIIISFSTTQRLYGVLNMDYLILGYLTQRDSQAIDMKINELEKNKSSALYTVEELTRRLSEINAKINTMQSDPNYEKNAARPGRGPIENIMLEKKLTEGRLDDAKSQLVKTDSTYESIIKERKDLTDRLAGISSEGTKLYLVARALALGALGAAASVLSLIAGNNQANSLYTYSSIRVYASLLIGSLVSIVAFGLFYTRQITIFSTTNEGVESPDYWKTTILCLVAGAFADRLFQAAAGRVDFYLGRDHEKKVKETDESLKDSK